MRVINKALEAFDCLFERAYGWVHRQSPTKIRNGEVKTKPGELVEALPADMRQDLKNLKSEDLAEGKVPLVNIHVAADSEYYTQKWEYSKMLKEEKIKFDTQLLKAPPRADRKKY